jgi:uncharacterized protein
MHPDVCVFISEIVLCRPAPLDESAARRITSCGTGIRFVPVEQGGNRTASNEEVTEIAKLIAELRQGTFTNSADSTRQLRDDDFMIVAPYDDQVHRLCAGLPAGVRVELLTNFRASRRYRLFL